MASNSCAGQRGLHVLLLLCCNAVLYINRANMSVAVTFMYDKSDIGARTQALAAFYCGYPLLQLLAGQWAAQHGGKRVLLIASLFWAVATLLVIPAQRIGLWAVSLVRVVAGAAEGVNYPAQMGLVAAWVPLEERSRAFSVLASGEPLGTMMAMLGCAVLGRALGWEAIFVASAALSVAWALAFGWLAARMPEESSRVSAEELAHITSGRGDLDPYAALGWRGVPWSRMLRSQALLAIIVPHICFNWGYYLCLSTLPDYFQTVLHVQYEEMGALALLPYATLLIVAPCTGLLADRLLLQRWGLPLLHVRKLCTLAAMGIASCCFLALRGVHSRGLTAVLAAGAVGAGGISFSGFQVNFLDISPKFSPQLMGISNTLASLPGVLGVMSLTWFKGDFDAVFTFAAMVELLGALWYTVLGKAEDQQYERPASRELCRPALEESCRL